MNKSSVPKTQTQFWYRAVSPVANQATGAAQNVLSTTTTHQQ